MGGSVKKNFQNLFSNQTKIDFYDYVYDRQDPCGIFLKQRMDQALSWIDGANLSNNSKILDAGCGAGRLTRELSERGYAAFGMDYSYGMLERANSICNHGGNHNVELFQGDIESMPFKDSRFDMIICLGVITYLKSEEKALNELARVLKPEGTLILSVINKFRLVKHLDLPFFLKHRLEKILRSDVGIHMKKTAGINHDANVTTYFIPQLRNSLQVRGFTVLEYTTIPHELLTFYGREIFPQKIGVKISMFFDKLSHVPIVGSFGGMCIFKAKKNPLEV
jgi:ubiquinone/menaquinone biosynthesis C-methylase UbiE